MMSVPSLNDCVYFSYPLSKDTPGYGGARPKFIAEKTLEQGDSCNALQLSMSNHCGTHIDAPRHFLPGGKSIDQYEPHELLFTKITSVPIPLHKGRLITEEDLASYPLNKDADAVLLMTGFSRKRGEEDYIFDGPGLSASGAKAILEKFPNVRMVGVDFISLNRFSEREEGRKAHRLLLGHSTAPIIVEDMDLSVLMHSMVPAWLWVAPLRILQGDGAPASVIGEIKRERV